MLARGFLEIGSFTAIASTAGKVPGPEPFPPRMSNSSPSRIASSKPSGRVPVSWKAIPSRAACTKSGSLGQETT